MNVADPSSLIVWIDVPIRLGLSINCCFVLQQQSSNPVASSTYILQGHYFFSGPICGAHRSYIATAFYCYVRTAVDYLARCDSIFRHIIKSKVNNEEENIKLASTASEVVA